MNNLEVIQLSQQKIAKCLLDLSVVCENLKVIDLNDADFDLIDIQMDVEAGALKLGFALAALTDVIEEKTGHKEGC